MTDTVQQFRDIRATMRKNEVWRDVDFSNMMPDGMKTPQPTEIENKDYPCNIPGINTIKITVINGRCVTPYYVRLDGVSYGSLTEACKICPDLIGDYLCKCTKSDNPYEKINASNYEDGVFIYIPDGTLYNPTFQIVNIIDSKEPIFVQTRNLVVVGKRATLTLLQCDDSIGDSRSMSNNVTEIFAGLEAQVQHYKLQNMNDMSGLLNHSYAQLEEKAVFSNSVVTLNGGHIRNHAEVNMLDEHCRVDANGLYLIDKEQQSDNYIFVNHAKPNCQSHALYKGIMDDSAHATFNGHVLVSDGAVKTEAYQTNRNILLTDKATVQSKPFLEIYNDDVKCSHGSTTGQIDELAMFYIRSRGISERTARTMLLYAFCDEVIQKIGYEPLRNRLSDMVKQRLHGELTPCSECALHCNNTCGCNDAPAFEIDADKL
ncbi:MAG: Fe-S cluster assembly protein SufD [Bacteroidales bacterium]|nr:Fe-S cluster assembly protein SufD [Bacteroidales bacterium]